MSDYQLEQESQIEPNMVALERTPEEQARIDAILESATQRHIIKKLVHSIGGHPREQVYWGTAIEGATCSCGAHMTNADFRV